MVGFRALALYISAGSLSMLRLKRLALRSVSLSLLMLAGLIVFFPLQADSLEGSDSVPVSFSSTATSDEGPITPNEEVFSILLQRPLFDPPPPEPVVEEVAPPPPLNVRLIGTIMNGDNSQAIVESGGGDIAFLKIGQSVSKDNPQSVIESIDASSIVVSRGEHTEKINVQ